MEFLAHEGPLAPFVVDVVVSEDEEALGAAADLERSRGTLVQKALRARCRLCYAGVVRREARLDRTYDFVVRARPDYAFDCKLPPLVDQSWLGRRSAWATTHRDYWEIMSRDVAEAGLRGVWVDGAERLSACRPKRGATEAGTRVESCLYFALCSAGADVRAGDIYYATKRERRASRGPGTPGVIIRPCCDPRAIHGKLLLPPPTATCALDYTPVLGNWLLGAANRDGQTAWAAARRDLLVHLGPRCRESLPTEIPEPPGDDDDDDGQVDDDDDRATARAVRQAQQHRDELRRR